MMKYVFISLLTILFLTGCMEPEVITKYKPVTVTKIVYKTKEVKVPVYIQPNIPDIHCDFNGTNFQPTVKLLQCVILQKHLLDKLRQQKNIHKK